MDKEYKKVLIENFYEYFDQDDFFDQDDLLENADRFEDYLIKIWLEATRQADDRSKTNE